MPLTTGRDGLAESQVQDDVSARAGAADEGFVWPVAVDVGPADQAESEAEIRSTCRTSGNPRQRGLDVVQVKLHPGCRKG